MGLSVEVNNRSLVERMWQSERLLDTLCDPQLLDTEAAIALANQIMKVQSSLDVRLASELLRIRDRMSCSDVRIERCLEVLDAISPGRRLVLPLINLMQSGDARVRSKAARFLGRRVENLIWARKHIDEFDHRVRANVVEGLWGSALPQARDLLWHSARDRSNRVRGNALLGLYKVGDEEALPVLRDLADHQDPLFRATGAWVMGASGDPRFLELLKRLRNDPQSGVRAAALRALVKIKKAEGQWFEITHEDGIQFCEVLQGSRRIGFDIAAAGALRPTDIVMTNNGETVWQYSFRETGCRPIRVVIMVFDCEEDQPRPAIADILASEAATKDPNDQWSVVRVEARHADVQFSWQNETQQLESYVRPAVLPPYKGASLQDAIANFEELPLIRPRDMDPVIRLLGASGSNRHLLLVLSPSSLTTEETEGLTELARRLTVVVDIISLQSEGNEQLQSLARQTNGAFTTASATSLSSEWFTRFYAGLSHRYEVSYEGSSPADSFEMKLRIAGAG